MRNKSIPFAGSVLALMFAGCFGGGSPLVTQAEFDTETNGIFDPAQFDRRGGGAASGGDHVEFNATYEPRDPSKPLHFNFTAWDTLLSSRDTFSGHGRGGSQGLHWRRTWRNGRRFIVIEAVAMKNGHVRVTYREILR